MTDKTVLPRNILPNMAKKATKRGPGLAPLMRQLAQAAQGNRAGYLAWFKTGKGEYVTSSLVSECRRSVPSPRSITVWDWTDRETAGISHPRTSLYRLVDSGG